MSQADSPKPAEPEKPKLSWYQYSLGGLLIFPALCAVFFAWWSHSARKQRAAVAWVENLHGSVKYDFQKSNLNRPPHWPVWLVDSMGLDYFANVEEAYISD